MSIHHFADDAAVSKVLSHACTLSPLSCMVCWEHTHTPYTHIVTHVSWVMPTCVSSHACQKADMITHMDIDRQTHTHINVSVFMDSVHHTFPCVVGHLWLYRYAVCMAIWATSELQKSRFLRNIALHTYIRMTYNFGGYFYTPQTLFVILAIYFIRFSTHKHNRHIWLTRWLDKGTKEIIKTF